ncbi:MAG: ribonuclease PH [Chloroflexi bacterium]|nr:ribonuclease PH [Chloroflexota bacterium]
MPRPDSRQPRDMRPLTIETGVQVHAEGSAMIALGLTRVLCAVSVEERVPPFLRGSGAGWITAEYGMLPRSTNTRSPRETSRIGGRTHEIQRLIGRSLRAVANLDLLGERTFTVDCDVIQADGGTRTAAITGGYIALALAMQRLVADGLYAAVPLTDAVAATSVGLVDGEVRLDLAYEEDSQADVDFNIVKTSAGVYVEIQGTAEGQAFSRDAMNAILDVADAGLDTLFQAQLDTLATADNA